MATIKSYTDLEQSKKLAEILPFESADLYYDSGDEYDICFGSGVYEEISYWICEGSSKPADIPCWSLATLMNVLPVVLKEDYYLEVEKLDYSNPKHSDYRISWRLSYINCYNEADIEVEYEASDLLDACYKMILKLHELNLL